MSKKMNPKFRKRLLATASAAALMVSAGGSALAETNRPLFWIDFGAQYERLSGTGDLFAPPFTNAWPNPAMDSPLSIERLRMYSYGANGKIAFQPEHSDWVFTAAVRFGRSSGSRHVHQQSSLPPASLVPNYPTLASSYPSFASYHIPLQKFAETRTSRKSTHAIVDFQAGKDVGLGMFGHDSTSVLSVGLRFAQFNTKSVGSIYARPDIFTTNTHLGPFVVPLKYFHDYSANEHTERSFRGLGPSISWNASVPLMGSADGGEVALDWGVNAALLFGRQKASVHHQTINSQYIEHYFNNRHPPKDGYFIDYQTEKTLHRSKNVTVPNIGGFAGLSFRYIDAKISLGYRADFFMNAIDGGWDTSRDATRSFMGPFASVSIGIGD